MPCFLRFLCFSKCLRICISFFSSTTLCVPQHGVVLPSCVFFFWGGCCFYCMPPTRSCLSGEQRQWDLYVSGSLCGPHHHWLLYCLAALAPIHAHLNPPTVLCAASLHAELQRLPCAALFIKASCRWLDFGHHCCTRSAHTNIHETVIVWLCCLT